MKESNILAGLFLAFLFSSSLVQADEKTTHTNATYEMPEKVKTVIDNKCFGCHNTDSRSKDAKEKLDFNGLDSLTKVKKVGAFNDMSKVIEEGKMPPQKFLEKRPEQALTDKEKKILTHWLKEEISAIIKE